MVNANDPTMFHGRVVISTSLRLVRRPFESDKTTHQTHRPARLRRRRRSRARFPTCRAARLDPALAQEFILAPQLGPRALYAPAPGDEARPPGPLQSRATLGGR